MYIFGTLDKIYYADLCNYVEGAMNRIKELRMHAGMSQADLASRLQCTPGAVSKWENGQRKIPGLTLTLLCEIFGCSTDYLLGLSDINSKKPAPAIRGGLEENTALFKRVQEANELFLGLDTEGQAQALAYLTFLAGQQDKRPERPD